jgi:hypothetical protein
VDVLGLELEQLGERRRGRLVPAAPVEAHGVLRRRRRDDDRRVAGVQRALLEGVVQLPADFGASATEAR